MKDLIQNVIELNTKKFELLSLINKPKIGFISINTPEEIVYAAGMLPVKIMGEVDFGTSEASSLLHHNICSYILSCLSEGRKSLYDFTDGIIITDSCDARRRLFDVWKNFIKPQYIHLIDLPKDINPLSREYFRLQIRKLIQSIENHFKCKITSNALMESIKLCNETRALLQRLYELRKTKGVINSINAISIIKSSFCGLKKEFNDRLSSLITEIESQETKQTDKKHTVLITGSYFDHVNILSFIEKCGANVVCEDISNGIKYFEGQINTVIDPVEAIADFYFEKSFCARMIDTDRRLKRLFNLIKEYGIQSVIYFSLKFCDNNLIDFPYIRRQLQNKGIPMLLIEGERHMPSIENIKTRIQTFLEIRV